MKIKCCNVDDFIKRLQVKSEPSSANFKLYFAFSENEYRNPETDLF